MVAKTLKLYLAQVASNKLLVTFSEALDIHNSPALRNTGMSTFSVTCLKTEKI